MADDPAWRKSLVDASFRGVAFKYKSITNTMGRQSVEKNFAGQDNPRVEDLGARLPRRFTMEMFIIDRGGDYFPARDALIAALETKGSGELVHPYRGKINATLVGEASMTETTDEGGIARFTCTFVQTDDLLKFNTFFQVPDPVSQVLGAVARAKAAVSNAFKTAFSVVHAVEATVQSAVNAVQSVASAVNQVRGAIASSLLVVSNAEEAINDLSDNAAALVQTPALLATTMLSVPDTVLDDVKKVTDSAAYEASISFYSNEDSLPNEGNVISSRAQVDATVNTVAGFLGLSAIFAPVSTIAAQQLTLETNNQNALSRLARAANIFAVAGTIVTLTFESYDQAQTMLGAISGLIDDLLEDDTLEDEVYGPLADLRAALAGYLASIANALPELQTFTPVQTVPALVVAYELYGDAAFESDVLARNTQVTDPSAVRGGQPLQVLFNA